MSSISDNRTCKCSRPKCSDFGLGGVSPLAFVQMQCRLHYSIYLVYRLVVTLYLLGYFLYNVIITASPGGLYDNGYYIIYLTNWGYILMLAYLILALWNLIVFAGFMRPAGWTSDDDIPWYFFPRCQWLLFNMYASVALVITLLYWGALFVPGAVPIYYDINFHLLNGVVALVEVIFTATLVRLLHFIYPFLFAFAYVIFSVIYWVAGGTDEAGEPYIYPILDYGANPGTAAGLAVGACVAVVIVHTLLVWGIHRLKVLILANCCSESCMPDEERYESGEATVRATDFEMTTNNKINV